MVEEFSSQFDVRVQQSQGYKGDKLAETLALTAASEMGNKHSEIIQFIILINTIIPIIIPIYNTFYLGDFCVGSLPVFDFSSENKLPLC